MQHCKNTMLMLVCMMKLSSFGQLAIFICFFCKWHSVLRVTTNLSGACKSTATWHL